MVVLSRLLFVRNQKIFDRNGLLNKLIQKSNNNNNTFQNQGDKDDCVLFRICSRSKVIVFCYAISFRTMYKLYHFVRL